MKPTNQALLSAIEKGDKEEVKSLVDQGADINFRTSYGYTPLMHAMKCQQNNIVDLLLAEGANIMYCYHRLLCYAVLYGYTNVLELFLTHERVDFVDFNATDNSGNTLLFTATFLNNVDAIKLLLANKKVRINASSQWDGTPLHIAVFQGNIEAINLLLKHGADVNAQGIYDRTPIYNAVENGDAKSLFTLLIFGATLSEDNKRKIDAKPNLKNCLTEFEAIKVTHHLGKLIKAYKDGNTKTISQYINDKTDQKELIEKFKNVKEHCSSNEQLTFIPEHLSDFIEHMAQQYLQKHKKELFTNGGFIGLLKQLTNKDLTMIVKNYVLDSSDAHNLSMVCQNTHNHANSHMSIHYNNETENVSSLLSDLKDPESKCQRQMNIQ